MAWVTSSGFHATCVAKSSRKNTGVYVIWPLSTVKASVKRSVNKIVAKTAAMKLANKMADKPGRKMPGRVLVDQVAMSDPELGREAETGCPGRRAGGAAGRAFR